jgi:anion transporter
MTSPGVEKVPIPNKLDGVRQTSSFEAWGKKYGLILGLALGVLIWLLPTPAGMTLTQHKLLTLFAVAVVLWITIAVNFAVSAFFVVSVLYFWVGNATGSVKGGWLVRDANFAVSGYGSPALFLLVTGFVISIAMTHTGVARRIALLMMKALGRTPRGAIGASMFANLVIAPLTPSNTARTAAMLPIIQGIGQAYKVEPGKSNFGRALGLSQTFAGNITGSAFLTGTIPNPIAIGMMLTAVGASAKLTWGYWALAALPTNVIILLFTGWLCLRMFPPEMKEIPGGMDYVNAELAAMGKMSAQEKKAIFWFLAALAFWSTDFYHGFNSTMVAFATSTMIFAPKIGVLDWKTTEKLIPWELFIYFGGVITLSDVLTKTKAFEWIIRTALSGLGIQSLPLIPLVIVLMGFTIFSHAIWSTTTAMAGVMIPIYIGIAQTLHLDIIGFTLPMAILMAYALFFPFNTMGNIILFGSGYYSVENQVKSSVLVGIGSWILWTITALTWWRFIGLF